jgi:hypothetical protein
MLGTRGPQRGLFEADALYADYVGRGTFYAWLATQRGELFPDELFLSLYVAGWGRPLRAPRPRHRPAAAPALPAGRRAARGGALMAN